MSALYTAIVDHAKTEAEAGDWTAVATKLNTGTIYRADTTVWTSAKIMAKIGEADTNTVLATMKSVAASSPIMEGALLALNLTGLTLFSDERKAMVAALASAGSWDQSLIDKVAELSGKDYTIAEIYNIGTPTDVDCQTVWEQQAFNKQWNTLNNAIQAEVDTAGPSNKTGLLSALQAAIDALNA